jgi:hypothetical protein
MSKKRTIFISILLILSAVIIEVLSENADPKPYFELFDFFSGFTFGIGLAILVWAIWKKKQK